MGAARKGTTNYIADLWRPSPRTVFCMKSIKKKKKKETPKGDLPPLWLGAAHRKEWRAPGRVANPPCPLPWRWEGIRPLSGLSALLSGLGTLRKGRAS